MKQINDLINSVEEIGRERICNAGPWDFEVKMEVKEIGNPHICDDYSITLAFRAETKVQVSGSDNIHQACETSKRALKGYLTGWLKQRLQEIRYLAEYGDKEKFLETVDGLLKDLTKD